MPRKRPPKNMPAAEKCARQQVPVMYGAVHQHTAPDGKWSATGCWLYAEHGDTPGVTVVAWLPDGSTTINRYAIGDELAAWEKYGDLRRALGGTA